MKDRTELYKQIFDSTLHGKIEAMIDDMDKATEERAMFCARITAEKEEKEVMTKGYKKYVGHYIRYENKRFYITANLKDSAKKVAKRITWFR